ncbi:hypothetical protein [Moorena sp. SIO3B2]|uniref:hypothetical protein n=1 Tax=Moorena sp. SIO3B2 TaxID=2607827 RepID=UPI0013C6486F|nr:hypothetical protein [Moorena sp. SIO3B2]NEP34863.1 hypothetical protein [Moorena sp. SIO3B2]NEP53248.1 hypothetical protein [Moorena sp. SIO3C2]
MEIGNRESGIGNRESVTGEKYCVPDSYEKGCISFRESTTTVMLTKLLAVIKTIKNSPRVVLD